MTGHRRNSQRRPRKRMSLQMCIMQYAGIVLVLAGLIVVGRIPYFYLRSRIQGTTLLHRAEQSLAAPVSTTTFSQPSQSVSSTIGIVPLAPTEGLAGVSSASLIGYINIPSLALQAPLLQGTDDAVLNVGAGHLSASVMPGKSGTSVIAAHNATWFRHIDDLHPGDKVIVHTVAGQFTFSVTRSQVVKVGTPVTNTADSTLVLEACYPLDALYLTPYRYLVFGSWTATTPALHDTSAVPSVPDNAIHYHALVPNSVLQEGITLANNALPMGTLTYSGQPDLSYTQSTSPLSASSTLLQLYLAWVQASGANQENDLLSLLSTTKQESHWTKAADPLFGISPNAITYTSPFDVKLTVAAHTLQSMTGTTTLSLPSGQSYDVTLTALANASGLVTLGNISFQMVRK